MPDFMDVRRKRLLFRCCHMGTVENDLIFGGFARANLERLDDGQLACLEALLKENDNDLYNWLTGKEPPPPVHDNEVMKMLRSLHDLPRNTRNTRK
ncbi:MAG: hypothetical protein A3G18_07375 [Rhodospirillales bacterium RIFCSPLOWO2_12_FULL_58_28]|nr:MAG: hypothetical protein A3H92_08845 [Rhodospirillales bacterium RIFCSPLOWO2_02_FULL_58_16]OHC77547.1 MAG: hypothetical protein A3G18_07375 [Rhodospirillales bacterium RIFCSPLOWO2_12_FULL_58_28]